MYIKHKLFFKELKLCLDCPVVPEWAEGEHGEGVEVVVHRGQAGHCQQGSCRLQ